MRLHHPALGLIAFALSCTGGGLGDVTGAGGTLGSCEADFGTSALSGAPGSDGGAGIGGGSGGTTGGGTNISGSGGSGGGWTSPYPACSAVGVSGSNAGGYIADADGVRLMAPLTATVTVTSFDSTRATLTDVASGKQWNWWLAIPNLPADRLNLCERYDLVVDASPCPWPASGACQTVVLARDGALIAFTTELQSSGLPIPPLGPWGIAVAYEGGFCDATLNPYCGVTVNRARITIGSQSLTLAPGQTDTLDGVSISVGRFESIVRVMCDAPATTSMAGFRLP